MKMYKVEFENEEYIYTFEASCNSEALKIADSLVDEETGYLMNVYEIDEDYDIIETIF